MKKNKFLMLCFTFVSIFDLFASEESYIKYIQCSNIQYIEEKDGQNVEAINSKQKKSYCIILDDAILDDRFINIPLYRDKRTHELYFSTRVVGEMLLGSSYVEKYGRIQIVSAFEEPLPLNVYVSKKFLDTLNKLIIIAQGRK